MIRKILHKILGIDKVITQLNGRVTLIENVVGINNFMSNDEGNIFNELSKSDDLLQIPLDTSSTQRG